MLSRSTRERVALLSTALFLLGCGSPGIELPSPQTEYWDAHTHLSLYGPAALDSLHAYGIIGVRDLGTDLDQTLRWRHEIATGRRRGPRIYTAGVILDGPKEEASPRWMLSTPEEAEQAVDSLARRGVDFIKTHNGLARSVYFAILRRARVHGLRVASHLPRGVPAWEAADSGAGSIEHAAESMLASPLYAGRATTVEEAMDWWRSAAGDSALQRLARSGVFVTPTLAMYAANVNRPDSEQDREGRRRVLDFLVELTGRMYRAGIPLLAGSDLGPPDGPVRPGASLYAEMEWLARAGLPEEAVRRVASDNVEQWLRSARRP